jgi:asparagine synthase (glutamine-hydrolysing)
MSAFLPEELVQLFSTEIDTPALIRNMYAELDSCTRKNIRDPLDLGLYIDTRMYLQDDVLAKIDRASMAVSLEVRAPFLDRDVVEFVARLPFSYKLHGMTTKYILKKAMKGILPKSILERKKQGFALPLTRWLRKELSPLVDAYLNRDRMVSAGFFNPDYVQQLINEHQSGRKDHRKALWALLVFELWRERYG